MAAIVHIVTMTADIGTVTDHIAAVTAYMHPFEPTDIAYEKM